MKITVLDGLPLNGGDNPWDPVAALGELVVFPRTPPEMVLARAKDATVIITNKAPITSEMMAALPQLRLIAVTATGYNIVDTVAASRHGITVCNVPEYSTNAVAQFAIALLLELCHQIGLHDTAVHRGEWTASPDFTFQKTAQIELAGLTIGIVGYGKIGRRVGEIATALGMRILQTGRSASQTSDKPGNWRPLDKLFAESDVVTLHCPQTPENFQFVGKRLLSMMKPSAFLINTARGALVDEAALADALNAGQIAGAAVDVVSKEPMVADNPLLSARNCIITPHIAWAARSARVRAMQITADNIKAFIAGTPINVVR